MDMHTYILKHAMMHEYAHLHIKTCYDAWICTLKHTMMHGYAHLHIKACYDAWIYTPTY